MTLGKLLQIKNKENEDAAENTSDEKTGTAEEEKNFPMLLMERKLRKQYLLLSITN